MNDNFILILGYFISLLLTILIFYILIKFLLTLPLNERRVAITFLIILSFLQIFISGNPLLWFLMVIILITIYYFIAYDRCDEKIKYKTTEYL